MDACKNLRAGDILVLSNCEFVVVEWIQHEILESPVKVYNFEVEDFHTYFVGKSSVWVHNMCVEKGTLEKNNVSKDKKLALGLSDYLDDFAEKNNAHTWKNFNDPNNWRDGVLDALYDPNTQIIFNLDGIDNPMSSVMRASHGAGGATDWELLQIKYTPDAWDRITWYKNGDVVPNPFA